MKKSEKIATVIKDHLIHLAINDNLPTDLTQLDINSLIYIIETIENSEEEKQLKRIEKAGIILFEEEDGISIVNQIKLIEEHADNVNEDDLIDDVDGVTIAESGQYSFTCESFLDTING